MICAAPKRWLCHPAVSPRIADMEQKTRQHAKETSGDPWLLGRAVVKDRRAVERCSRALTRYVSSQRDKWEDDQATSMSSSVLSSKAMGSSTACESVSCVLRCGEKESSRTVQESIVLQVSCQHGVKGLYVVPQCESSVQRPGSQLLRIVLQEACRRWCHVNCRSRRLPCHLR